MKKKIFLFIVLCCFLQGFSQEMSYSTSQNPVEKKPMIMVLPSDHWCSARFFTKTIENQGKKITINDYESAFREDAELSSVVSLIGEIMTSYGYSVKDYMQEYKSIMDDKVEEEVTMSSSGAMIDETPLDMLRRRVKYDIELRVDWTVNKETAGKSITFNISAIDAYSNKQVAAANGTDKSSEMIIPRLIETGIAKHMDNFNAQLVSHFTDIQKNGREIILQIKVWESSDVNLEEEYGDEELIDIISEWMEKNTVKGVFNLSNNTETRAKYEQVRIPMFNDKGRAMDARMYATKLRQFLKTNYSIDSKVMNKGLGEAVIVIGEK